MAKYITKIEKLDGAYYSRVYNRKGILINSLAFGKLKNAKAHENLVKRILGKGGFK